jgi:cytochrome c peroxidase
LNGVKPSGEILSISAQKGLKLFIDGASTRCMECHNGPRFSNGGFHNIGTGSFSGLDIDLGRSLGMSAVVLDEFNCLGEYSDAPKHECQELRFMQNDAHNMSRGAFKTPSLRNVSNTGPYYHDGRFQSLEEVVGYYQKPPATPYGNTHELTPLTLSLPEIDSLLDFLQEL